jgi:hypothetical protein
MAACLCCGGWHKVLVIASVAIGFLNTENCKSFFWMLMMMSMEFIILLSFFFKFEVKVVVQMVEFLV